MALVIFGKEGNFRARAAQIAAEIAEIPLTLQAVESKDLKSKEHLARNPLGQVPVLKAPEGYIYQTNAILRYIASVSNPQKGLYGSNEFEKSLIDQWLDFDATELLPALTPINYKIWGYKDSTSDEINAANQSLQKLYKLLDDSLKGRKFLVGETLTIADIIVYLTLVWAYRCYFDEKFRKTYAALTEWFENTAQNPKIEKYFGKTRYSSKPWF